MRLALEELSIKASDDPQVRLKYLRDEQARIAAEIEEIEQHGQVKTLAPTRIREQFALAVRMLRELQGDFRAVEEEFKDITRQVQQRQVQGLDPRGGILGNALGAEDALKGPDQGVTFFEFLRFIQSPQQQDRLRDIIRQLICMRELADQTKGLETIRHMVRGLLDEAEKVLQTYRNRSEGRRSRSAQSAAQRSWNWLASILSEWRSLCTCSPPPGIAGNRLKYDPMAWRIPARQAFVLIQFCGLKTRFAGCGSFAAASSALFKHVPAMSTT